MYHLDHPPRIDFSKCDSDEVQHILLKHNLRLTIEEARTLQRLLNRAPTLAECVLWSIQGSEHCSYKSSKHHLQKLSYKAPHVLLGPTEDAGIVSVATDNQGTRYGLVVSHESHNHPSQIAPYEGAATGVGGNVRDVVCMGAEVIAIGNGLRFGDIHRIETKEIQEGVVAGISGYANPIGVPTVSGDVYYHPHYNNNCLVTIVTLGIVREDEIIHSYIPTDVQDAVFILVGKATDGSGFAGAAFASETLQDSARNRCAIQEPNAFLKNHLLKAHYALFHKLKEIKCLDKVGFKDLGAGGIACASIEMATASGLGAIIDLEEVPLSIPDLPPEVVLCSETQERFMWLVPQALKQLILDHYNTHYALADIAQDAQAKVIGKVSTDGLYTVQFKNFTLVQVPARRFTSGIRYDRPYYPKPSVFKEPFLQEKQSGNHVLLKLLAHEQIASRACVFENYDQYVQGRTIFSAGEADAGLLQPFNEEAYPVEIRQVAVAFSLDQCPAYNLIDPYWGAVNAVIESARNVTAIGATPLAITDCLCFGNPEKPDHLWAFTEAVRGIKDACKAIGIKEDAKIPLPTISGNVSFYNESPSCVIPPSPMISCIGALEDVDTAITFHLKERDSLLLLVGERRDECGGSAYYSLYGELGAQCPKPNLQRIGDELRAVQQAIEKGLLLAAHDISDGGLAIALAEMTFKNSIGIRVDIPGRLSPMKKLFSETGGFVLEVRKEAFAAVQECFSLYNTPLFHLGYTQREPLLQIGAFINVSIAEARLQWQNGLRDKLW